MLRAILIGAPGCGKSSVGKALSRELSTSFEDSDALIVEREGRSIPEIFEAVGEPGFRVIEREVVLSALASNVGVLALGGGSVLDPAVQDAITKSSAIVIFLRVGLSNVLARLTAKGERPLVAEDPKRQWLEILARRQPIYEKLATLEIDTDNKKSHEVARELIIRMGLSHD